MALKVKDLAKELGVTSDAVIEQLRSLYVDVEDENSAVDPKIAGLIKIKLGGFKPAPKKAKKEAKPKKAKKVKEEKKEKEEKEEKKEKKPKKTKAKKAEEVTIPEPEKVEEPKVEKEEPKAPAKEVRPFW